MMENTIVQKVEDFLPPDDEWTIRERLHLFDSIQVHQSFDMWNEISRLMRERFCDHIIFKNENWGTPLNCEHQYLQIMTTMAPKVLAEKFPNKPKGVAEQDLLSAVRLYFLEAHLKEVTATTTSTICTTSSSSSQTMLDTTILENSDDECTKCLSVKSKYDNYLEDIELQLDTYEKFVKCAPTVDLDTVTSNVHEMVAITVFRSMLTSSRRKVYGSLEQNLIDYAREEREHDQLFSSTIPVKVEPMSEEEDDMADSQTASDHGDEDSDSEEGSRQFQWKRLQNRRKLLPVKRLNKVVNESVLSDEYSRVMKEDTKIRKKNFVLRIMVNPKNSPKT